MIHLRSIYYFLVFISVSLISLPLIGYAQNRTISANLQINDTAINKFISSQTFPTLNGTYSNYNYNITISSPIVQLNNNSAAVQFTIQANTTVGNYAFTVQPTIRWLRNILETQFL